MAGTLLDTLQVVRHLGEAPDNRLTASELQERFGISSATLKRTVAEARHLGAAILPVQQGRAWYYHLHNWQDCKKLTLRWIELEEQRSLIER